MSVTTRGPVHAAGVPTAAPPARGAASRGSVGRRHPLVALAMVLPLAVALAMLIGGIDAVVTQASSVAGTLGR